MLHTLLCQPLRHLRLVWLVLVIAVLGALVPTVSHALSHVQSSNTPMLLDLCRNDDAAVSPVHCPMCLLHAERAAPPPHVVVFLFAAGQGFAPPVFRPLVSFVNHVDFRPPPRGPPVFS
jgi:hypothetical protein